MAERIVPARETRAEIMVVNSRFIASAARVDSVESARDFISRVKDNFFDASHNVPAFIIGHGASIIEHCNDDGEPSGTAGRPALAVLKGSGLGNIAVVVTRYFGGTKLGTGGLVRAYSDAVRAVLAMLPRALLVPTHTVMLAVPYPLYEQVNLLVEAHDGQVLDRDFGVDVTLTARFIQNNLPDFQSALSELSRGALQVEVIESDEDTLMPYRKPAEETGSE
jgi:uncharacterized YigZ family protein